jgi:Sulfotransferase domain
MTGPLPQFLVIGAMKAGTTSLHHYLQAHPDLYLPETKELNFFRDPRTHARGEQWYRQQFAGAQSHQVPGEVSPDYAKHPHHAGAPERIQALIPDVKLIYLVRQPIDRMRSMYLHQVVAGREQRPIDEALLHDPHYLQVSQYAMQLDRYLRHFTLDQILICSSEQLSADRALVLSRIHRFVGVRELPETGTAIDSEWYRGEDRRRRGQLARLMASVGGVRRAFGKLPEPLRDAVRRAGSKPVPSDARNLSADAEERLRELLRPDLQRFREYAPEITDSWRLLAPTGA